MNWCQLNDAYDYELKHAHWALIGVPDFDQYDYKGWKALSELQYLEMGYWMSQQEHECPEGPDHLHLLLDDIQFCVNCLEQGEDYHPDCMDESLDQVLWEMDMMVVQLDKWYPIH